MKIRFVLSALLIFGMSFGALAQDEGNVARSMFTTAVEDREPVDSVDKVPADQSTVYYYTDLRNLTDETVTHRWSYRGEVMAEVSFDVGGPRWRVWSSKNLRPTWTGQWTVAVVDGAGNELATNALIVGEEGSEAPASDGTMEEQGGDEPPTENGDAEQPAADEPKSENSGEPAADESASENGGAAE